MATRLMAAHREAFAAATTNGHTLLQWTRNEYRVGLWWTHCHTCGATLIDDGGGRFGGSTLRRTCAAIVASKRRKATR